MKRNISIIILFLIFSVIQISGINLIFGKNHSASIFLMFIFAGTILFGFSKVWKWIILAGLIFDIISYSVFGTNVIIFILTAYIASFFSRRMLVGNRGWGIFAMIFLVFCITFLNQFIYLLLSSKTSITILWQSKEFFIKTALWSYLFNIIFFFIAFFFLEKFKNYFLLPENKIYIK